MLAFTELSDPSMLDDDCERVRELALIVFKAPSILLEETERLREEV